MRSLGPAAPGSLQHPNGARVLGHDRIVGEQRNALDCRLGHQNTIKGVFMNGWQTFDGNDVFADNRQFAVSIIQQAAAQQTGLDPKSFRPNPLLIATSHKLATLNNNSLPMSSNKVRMFFGKRLGSPAAHNSR